MHERFVNAKTGTCWPMALLVVAGLSVGAASGAGATSSGGGRAGTAAAWPSASSLEPAYEAYIRFRSKVSSGHGAAAIPAFARKYGLRCSACHTAWPELNSFGQKFKDNGYQLGNDRDSPIWLNPSYWPIAIRTTPQWRLERTTHQPVDATPGDGASGTVERTITQSGFDISGADLLMLGTLYKNITFGFVPTVEDGAGVGIETAFVRFDNLFKSTWANLKFGKFELDNMLSEKRVVTLSTNGSFYQSYHFLPVGDANDFGIGDNQIGAELMGHSENSYTRFTVAVLDGSSGVPGLPAGKSYDGMITASQAFDGGRLGVQRIGVYGYLGRRPTLFQTVGGNAVPGTGFSNKSFYRVGAVGDFFLGNLEFLPLVMHASDDKYLATGTPGDQPLPVGARNASWNAALLETHYYVNPQLVLTQRDEFIRMSKQAVSGVPKKLGDVDAYSFGYRWYPIMISRAGLAVIGEVSLTKTVGRAPLSGSGAGLDPLSPSTAVWSSSLLMGLDFDF
jgi:hypothetical protein